MKEQGFFGHPKGLATLFFTEMWERFTYYGLRALLILFLTAAADTGGLNVPPRTAGAIYGLFTGAVYLFSLPGGWIADRLLGQRRSVFWGGVAIMIGNFTLAVPANAALFYFGLSIIVIGVGLLKPNISVLVGQLYRSDESARRDAAFSIFYFGINVGSFIAPLVAGTIGETIGYRWGFFVSGVAMLLGLIQYRTTNHWLGAIGGRPDAGGNGERRRSLAIAAIGAAIFLCIPLLVYSGIVVLNVEQLARATGAVMIAAAVFFFGYVLIYGGLDRPARKRVAVIALFFVCAALFWAGFEQAGSTFNLFARDYTDRAFLGHLFAEGKHPASWYQAINPIFILLLSPLFAWLWLSLARRNLDPSAPAKFGLGLIQLGLGFLVMMLAANFVVRSDQSVLPAWLVVTYLLHTTGELCLSPIGLSNVTRLAPPRFMGQMMGTWFLGAAIGNLAAGLIGGSVGGGAIEEMPGHFLEMALMGIGAGALMLLVTPWARRAMGLVR